MTSRYDSRADRGNRRHAKRSTEFSRGRRELAREQGRELIEPTRRCNSSELLLDEGRHANCSGWLECLHRQSAIASLVVAFDRRQDEVEPETAMRVSPNLRVVRNRVTKSQQTLRSVESRFVTTRVGIETPDLVE